jgi:hypothetical protein
MGRFLVAVEGHQRIWWILKMVIFSAGSAVLSTHVWQKKRMLFDKSIIIAAKLVKPVNIM